MSKQADVAMVVDALRQLPASCQYHGHNIEGREPWRYSGACCATGEPSLLRRRAVHAIQRLSNAPAAASEQGAPE